MRFDYTREDIAEAFASLCDEPGSQLRVGAYRKDELHAELYLTAASPSGTIE